MGRKRWGQQNDQGSTQLRPLEGFSSELSEDTGDLGKDQFVNFLENGEGDWDECDTIAQMWRERPDFSSFLKIQSTRFLAKFQEKLKTMLQTLT